MSESRNRIRRFMMRDRAAERAGTGRSGLRLSGFGAICIPAAAILVLCLCNNLMNSGTGDVFDLCMDVLGSLVCVLLYYGCMSAGGIRSSSERAFVATLFLNALTLFLDTAMWALDGNPGFRIPNLLVSTLFYVTDLLLFYQFWRYVRSLLGLKEGWTGKLDRILRVLLVPGILLCLGNLLTPVFFSISEGGAFQKAGGYALGFIYMLLIFLALIALLFRAGIPKWRKILSSVLALFPITALILTRDMPDLTIVYTVASISVLLINCALFTERIRMKELIIRIFSFLLLCAMLLFAPLLYHVSLQNSVRAGYERAEGAFAMMRKVLDEVGLENLNDPENTELYQQTREVMRAICRSLRLENLYVETIHPDDGIRYFVIAAAASDEADEMIRATLGKPGMTTWNENSYITEPEKQALAGETPESYSEQDNEYGHNLDWFCPYTDPKGRVLALMGADYEVRSQQAEAMRQTLSNILPVFFLYLITLLVLIRVLSRTFVRPIRIISGHIERFLADGNPNRQPLDVWGGHEIGQLAGSFGVMTSQLEDYEDRLKWETAQRERITAELNLASSIQANYLPGRFPPFPQRREFDLHAMMRPAKEVGGDFYDFFLIDQDHLALAVADVSGKGVPAALFMMLSKTMLKTAVQLGFSPAGVLEKVNEQLAEDNHDSMFVTVWLGILEISSGRLTYADAGHEKPVLYRDHRWEVIPKEKSGLPLGIWGPKKSADPMHPKLYEDRSVLLCPGDALVQYSDGVTEARDSRRQFFGESRLLSALNDAASDEPDQLLLHVDERIREFSGETPQFDDITLLCLRYNGS